MLPLFITVLHMGYDLGGGGGGTIIPNEGLFGITSRNGCKDCQGYKRLGF